MKPIKILIADDHTVVREGLSAMLSREQDIQVVGEAKNGVEAVNKAKELQLASTPSSSGILRSIRIIPRLCQFNCLHNLSPLSHTKV